MFWRNIHVHLQGQKTRQSKKMMACRSMLTACFLLISCLAYSLALKVRQHIPPKCWACTRLYSDTSLKTVIIAVTAMRTSNSTWEWLLVEGSCSLMWASDQGGDLYSSDSKVYIFHRGEDFSLWAENLYTYLTRDQTENAQKESSMLPHYCHVTTMSCVLSWKCNGYLKSRMFDHEIYVSNIWKYSNRDSSVGIATGYGLDDQGEREFESR
jgi:hypothetical protein